MAELAKEFPYVPRVAALRASLHSESAGVQDEATKELKEKEGKEKKEKKREGEEREEGEKGERREGEERWK